MTIKLLNLPEDLKKLTTRHFSASTIQDYNKKYKSKRQLKRDFEEYNINTGSDYYPMDPDLSVLVERASVILKREDYKSIFWKTVMGNIMIGLHENQYVGGPYAKYYNQWEEAFKVLLKNVMNYDENPEYLEDEYLY